MSKEGHQKTASELRDISADDDFQTVGTGENNEPLAVSPPGGPNQIRSNKAAKTRFSRLGPSGPSIAQPASSQVSAGGMSAPLSKRSETNPDLSAQTILEDDPQVAADPKQDETNHGIAVEPESHDPDPDVPLPASKLDSYKPDPIEDELASIPAQPTPTPVVPIQDPFEQTDDGIDDLDKMDGLSAIARNELPPPEIQVQGPSNTSSVAQSPPANPHEDVVDSIVKGLPKSRILSISSIPNPGNGTTNIRMSVADSARLNDTIERSDTSNTGPLKHDLPKERSLDIVDILSRRRRLIRRLRKILLRRRVLSILLGKELGDVAHSELNSVPGVESLRSIPLSAGPSAPVAS